MNTAELLTALEECPRKAYWLRLWERIKLDGNEMLQRAIRAGILSERTDFGDAAGEECYGFGVEPGLATSSYDVHAEVCHLACLADIVTTAIRKANEPPWKIPEELPLWKPSCFLSPDGLHLRRVVLVSRWNDDRHYHECRSWQSLGAVCAYGLPMQMAVIVLGQNRNGKRHSSWTKGLRHPVNKKLRFRKKNDVSEGFKSTWLPIWREDFDDISTHDWLQTMLNDGVLNDLCFPVEIPVPEAPARQRILDLTASKLEKVQNLDSLPEPQLSTCDWPVSCVFRANCHANKEPHKGAFRLLEE
jgi:hypothetical protein